MPLPILVAYGLRAGGAMLLKKVIKSKLGKEVKEKLKNAIIKKFAKRKIRKKTKALRERKEARRVKTEKDLKYSDSRPSPTITKTEAIARSNAKKEKLVQDQKHLEKIIYPLRDKAIADFRKRHPQRIGGEHSGSVNPYGHGKGLGKKIDRLTGTTKESVQRNRQKRRENKQVAKQRRQAGAPERRAVRRPKSGLYKDTPKKGT